MTYQYHPLAPTLVQCTGFFDLSATRFLKFFYSKMCNLMWKTQNYLLTLKLAYIYQNLTKILRFLCALSPRKLTRLGYVRHKPEIGKTRLC